MTTPIGPEFSQFNAGVFAQAVRDQRISPREVRQLQAAVEQMQSLSPAEKTEVNNFILSLHQSSHNAQNFLNPKREISAVDMALLEAISDQSPLTQQLLSQFKTADTTAAPAPVDNAVRQAADTPIEDPGAVSFPAAGQTQAQAGQSTPGELRGQPEWYLNQFNTGLNSYKSDCGPTSAAMVARSFGFQTALSERDVVDLSRTLSGGPDTGAINTDELSRAVERLSDGQVEEKSHSFYREGSAEQLLGDIQASLNRGERPILLSASSEAGQQPYRHYMVILGPDPQRPGHYLIADPGQSFDPSLTDPNDPRFRQEGGNPAPADRPFVRSASPEDFAAYIAETERTRNIGTELLTYSRV